MKLVDTKSKKKGWLQGRCPALTELLREHKDGRLAQELRRLLMQPEAE